MDGSWARPNSLFVPGQLHELVGQGGTLALATIQPTTSRLEIARITDRSPELHLTAPFSVVISHDYTW
jgi:hypothetical protein